MFDEREAGAGQGLHGIGFALGEMDLAGIAIRLGLAHREGLLAGQGPEEPFEIGRVLTRGIDAHVKMNRSIFLLKLLECLAEACGSGAGDRTAHRRTNTKWRLCAVLC